MSQKAKRAGRDAAFVAAGAGAVSVGAVLFVAAVVLALGLVMPLWLSALVVGAVVATVGVVLAKKGVHALKELDVAPRETIRTLKEDRAWARAVLSR
jgi:hypothetical protein